MATITFTSTDRKLFTTLSANLRNLMNGAGTVVVLYKKSVLGQSDFYALKDVTGTGANWYHSLSQNVSDNIYDDDGVVLSTASAADTDDTTNWHWAAADWPGGAAAVTRFHWRNQTTLSAWTPSNATGNNGGNARAGPTAVNGRLFIGHHGDESTSTRAQAILAIWPGTRFADADYGDWRKTSDLYNHARGSPEFLSELTSLTPTDIGLGGAVYDSTNSVGGALTGPNADNWTNDGRGAAPPPNDAQGGLTPAGMFDPELNSLAWF